MSPLNAAVCIVAMFIIASQSAEAASCSVAQTLCGDSSDCRNKRSQFLLSCNPLLQLTGSSCPSGCLSSYNSFINDPAAYEIPDCTCDASTRDKPSCISTVVRYVRGVCAPTSAPPTEPTETPSPTPSNSSSSVMNCYVLSPAVVLTFVNTVAYFAEIF